jgi:hypothetical protein
LLLQQAAGVGCYMVSAKLACIREQMQNDAVACVLVVLQVAASKGLEFQVRRLSCSIATLLVVL